MKIFITEDEPAIREELVQFLQKYGHQCETAMIFTTLRNFCNKGKKFFKKVLTPTLGKTLH